MRTRSLVDELAVRPPRRRHDALERHAAQRALHPPEVLGELLDRAVRKDVPVVAGLGGQRAEGRGDRALREGGPFTHLGAFTDST
jgi:hypothetical protein